MSFVRDPKIMSPFLSEHDADFYNVPLLNVFYRTKPEIIRHVLPEPLTPIDEPYAVAFFTDYTTVNFGFPYKEGGLLIPCHYKDVYGCYVLAMPVDGDMGMVAGREGWGFPKKMSKIEFYCAGDYAYGCVERHGTRFMEIHARLDGKPNDPELTEAVSKIFNKPGADGYALNNSFNFRWIPDVSGKRWCQFDPELTLAPSIRKAKPGVMGSADLIYRWSAQDPLAEIEVVKVLGATFSVAEHISLQKGGVLATVDPDAFRPYAFRGWDIPMVLENPYK